MSKSPNALARVRAQLGEIHKKINAGELTGLKATITNLVRKYPTIAVVNHTASGYFALSGARDQAIYYAQRAVELEPDAGEYHAALAVLLIQSDKHAEALPCLQQALALEPDLGKAASALAVVHLELGHIESARADFARAIELLPDDPEPTMNLALLESDIANAHKSVELMQNAIERFPDNPVLCDALCMFASYDDALMPEQVFAIHRSFGQCVQPKVRPPRSYPNTPDPEKRLRIGFVSPDFKDHSISYFVEPIFEHLDQTKFELCIYSTSSHSDHVTARLKTQADFWRDCTAGIADTHRQIVSDRPDILVELNGHFASNLLPLFAARPAPVSITAIGYGNTTGLGSITARIVDKITDPPPEADKLATEQLVRTNGCFLCYRPPNDAPGLTEPSPDRPFTFGSFNDLRKVSPSTLDTWAKILAANPETNLVLKSSRLAHQEVRDDLRTRFQALGIDPTRVELLARTAKPSDHLALYNRIDCSLDTFPYTGTTTTCESLYMGVPMLTLLGDAHAGRVSASLLTTIGRTELIADSIDSYMELASKIADAGVRSLGDRQSLRQQLLDSPLTDAASHTRELEAIYRTLWQSWCQSQEKRP